MGYLSKEQLLGASLKTTDVEAFGGTLCVSELPADLVQHWFDAGAINADGGMDLSKINMIEVASRVVRDPQTLEPMLSKADAKKLGEKSFGGIQAVVMGAMAITDFGEGEDSKN